MRCFTAIPIIIVIAIPILTAYAEALQVPMRLPATRGALKRGRSSTTCMAGLGGGVFSLKEYEKESFIPEGYKASTPHDASIDNLLGRKPAKGMASISMMLGLRVGLKL
ncbi:hypothetical protein U0035_12460 [Niabella yanshanensis]|uniref:Uncharacterized protein n=1 Tax=Niabella yanshanensis TaxID=577386 RepID=A0ABZ0W1N3_9BACT|nr:hypothetical protein [Niabella yanshanensis]WQD36479.1 hypothetical protein U0035_12460 [Niabella yanshanensis]